MFLYKTIIIEDENGVFKALMNKENSGLANVIEGLMIPSFQRSVRKIMISYCNYFQVLFQKLLRSNFS